MTARSAEWAAAVGAALDAAVPGSAELGALEYVVTLLDAFE